MAADLTAANVLVLYNSASTEGARIASYYSQVHPGVRLQAISGVDPASEDISADQYLDTIRPQVLAALSPSIDVIVTTKGLPLRIRVTEEAPTAPFGTLPTYVDPSGTVRQILAWQPFSSLESELAAIKITSTWQTMGDQSYAIPGNFTNNPYYQSAQPFDSEVTGTYLTSRLDGYTVSDVIASISRAQSAFVGPDNSPNGPFYFLVDNDPSLAYAISMPNLVNNVLTPAGMPVVYDNTSTFVSTAPGPIIAYDSHGVHQDSTPSNYINTGLQVALANGAVFNSWESYNAYSFKPGVYGGTQGQLAQWIARGGTVAVGNVEEPGASVNRVANEDQFVKALLAGKTWAEAAWSSLRQVSFVNTVVGDPLMRWARLPADGSATVVGRQLFYNNSKWDNHNPGADTADDAAVASNKLPYLPGSGPATFANVSSFAGGITGIMIDLLGPHGTLSAADFSFRVGNNNSPANWQVAPDPSLVTVRSGAGVGGSDRVELIWPEGAIRGTWLQVALKGNDALGGFNPDSGLSATDVFYFANAPGDAGVGDATGFSVSTADQISVINDPRGPGNPAGILNSNDFNRDGLVNSTDLSATRNFVTNPLTQLIFLDVSAVVAMARPLAATSDGLKSSGANALVSALVAPSAVQTESPRPRPAPEAPAAAAALPPRLADACFEAIASESPKSGRATRSVGAPALGRTDPSSRWDDGL